MTPEAHARNDRQVFLAIAGQMVPIEAPGYYKNACFNF